MSSLLKLTDNKLFDLFLEAMRKNAFEDDKYKIPYSLHHYQSGSFNMVDLTNLVFVAENQYQLWLIVYEFMLDKSNCNLCTTVIKYLDGKLIKKCVDDEEIEPYNMANIENLRSCIYDMMDDENDNDIEINAVVDDIVSNFFRNNTFWAREIKDDGYITESEDENDET